jgi:hypothetical protein
MIEWKEFDRDLDNLTNMLREYYVYSASKNGLKEGLDT